MSETDRSEESLRWPFNPEPLDALRNRVGVVLDKCWVNPDGSNLNEAHIFDHASGVRLMLSLEDHRCYGSALDSIVLHASVSLLDPEASRAFVIDHMTPSGGPDTDAIKRTIREYTENVLEGSGATIGEILAFVISPGKGIPHAFFEVEGYTAETLT